MPGRKTAVETADANAHARYFYSLHKAGIRLFEAASFMKVRRIHTCIFFKQLAEIIGIFIADHVGNLIDFVSGVGKEKLCPLHSHLQNIVAEIHTGGIFKNHANIVGSK
jgi:hypothetical protein